MKRFSLSFGFSIVLAGLLTLAGCTDTMFSEPEEDHTIERAATPVSATYSKLRHPQMLERARKEVEGASKTGSVEAVYDLVVEFDEDRITRRLLDKYRITRRILDKYTGNVRQRVEFDEIMKGITLQVKESYLDSLLAYLQSDPDITWIDPDIILEPNLPVLLSSGPASEQLVPWGVERIGARLAVEPSNVHVILMDSGISENADIAFDRGQDFTMLFQNRDQEYWDDEYEQEEPVFDPKDQGDMRDKSGHGTHMAGTIGAPDDEDGVVGVAPGVKIHSVKVLDENGRTDITTTVAAVDLLTYIKTERPELPLIVNMSFGTDIGTTAYNALDEAIARSIEAGVIYILSAGNDGRDASTYSPAHVEEAITVGAYDMNDRFAPYSNYGPLLDILAPGSDVVSLPHEFAESDDLVILDGTSSAAAHVTGAVALYVSQYPDATPQQVRDALVAMGQAEIKDAPPNTTNVSAYVGDALRDEDRDKAFRVRGATWDARAGALTVIGEGRRLEPVLVRSAFGAFLAATLVDYDALWSAVATDLAVVPCDVRVESWGTAYDVEVKDAPEGCEQAPELEKAEWRNGALTVEGEGTADRAVTLRSTHTGTHLLDTAFDADGQLVLVLNQLPEIPCSLRLESDGVAVDMAVSNAPLNCDGLDYLALSAAKWDKGRLLLQGDALGADGSLSPTVRLFNAALGTFVGEATADDGEWSVALSGVSVIPCAVRAELGEAAAERTVERAPLNCDGNAYVKLEKAKWDKGKLFLEGLALPGDNRPGATVTFTNAVTGTVLGTATLDDGEWATALEGLSVVPCTVRAELDGVADDLAVERAPASCQ